MMYFKSLLRGFIIVFSHLIKKRVTNEYPEQKIKLNKKFRGKHVLGECRGCFICQKVCPSAAITIEKNNKKVEKYTIDYSKCIFCGNCVYNCPFFAIQMTSEFELAVCEKQDLIHVLRG